MRGRLWVKVVLPLVGLWLFLHGPRLPGAMDALFTPDLPLLLGGVLFAGGLLLLVSALGVLVTPEVLPPRIWGEPGRRPGPRLYLASVAAVVGLSLVFEALASVLGVGQDGEMGRMQKVFAELGPGDRGLSALIIGLAPAVTEEIAFRGWVLSRIAAASGPRVGVVFSAVVFGLFHFEPAHAAVTAGMGLALGLSVVRTGALGPAIAAHAVNNALGVLTAGASLSALQLSGIGACGVILALWGHFVLLRRVD